MPLGSLDLRLVIFHAVMRTDPGAEGLGYESAGGISVFFGKLGSAVVSCDLGALGEAESDTAFLRDFLAGASAVAAAAAFAASVSLVLSWEDSPFAFFGVAEERGSVALRFVLAGDGEADVALSVCLIAVAVAVRLEERRAGVEEDAAGAILYRESMSRV